MVLDRKCVRRVPAAAGGRVSRGALGGVVTLVSVRGSAALLGITTVRRVTQAKGHTAYGDSVLRAHCTSTCRAVPCDRTAPHAARHDI